jgi:membrane protein
MIRLVAAWHRLRSAALAAPVLRVILRALRNYVVHQSANQAGSLAFSSVLAMFPLLILVSASAGFIGKDGDAVALAERVMGFAPQVVRDAMQPVIRQVLAQRNQALLTIGVGTGVLAAFSAAVIMPYVSQFLWANAGDRQSVLWLHNGVRYGSALVVRIGLYALLYGWLPDTRQRLYTVLPGALVGAALWVAAAATLSYTLQTVGKLALLYGSFAGVIATLVFLYIRATTLIFGAEINGVLRQTTLQPEESSD